MMRFKHLSTGCLLSMLIVGSANAAVIYSEDFNDLGFKGLTELPASTSDRYLVMSYSFMNDFRGWTFTGDGTAYALNGAGTDGAVNLNEWGPPTTATTTVSGLHAGETYVLSFLVYGDNLPGGNWELDVAVDGNTLLNVTGVDQPAGTNPGSIRTASFVAGGTSATLFFSQCCSTGGASPIFDDVKISNTPLPATIWLLAPVLAGLGTRRRREA